MVLSKYLSKLRAHGASECRGVRFTEVIEDGALFLHPKIRF